MFEQYYKNLNGRLSPRTLVFPITAEGKLILGLKKRGFGTGKLNGYGGKLESGESYGTGATRELHEELGITAASLNYLGMIHFCFPLNFPDDKIAQEVRVFACKEWEGKPVETEEMTFEEIDPQNIPYNRMWPDAKLYLEKIIALQTNWFLGVMYDESNKIIDSFDRAER
jgi:8-oxo-dGTP pyrophosphatase MutT (NUDIX family)